MRSVAVLAAFLAVVYALPTNTGDKPPTPVLVKELDGLRVQVLESREGQYIVQVYGKNSTTTQARISTLVWASPVGWHLPGQTARVVHAELLPTGDVIVVVYRPETGLDVVLLPEELFLAGVPTTTPQGIVFPNVTVPWHPTLSTEAYNWTWTYSEVTTPSVYPEVER